jgi:hypothetical protein
VGHGVRLRIGSPSLVRTRARCTVWVNGWPFSRWAACSLCRDPRQLCPGSGSSSSLGHAAPLPPRTDRQSRQSRVGWSIGVEKTTCAAAHNALAAAIVWRFATPAWNLNKNGVPTRWAPPSWKRCTVLGLWVNARQWSDGNVKGSKNRCTGSGERVLQFSWVHTGPWWVNEVGCTQSCPVTRT